MVDFNFKKKNSPARLVLAFIFREPQVVAGRGHGRGHGPPAQS